MSALDAVGLVMVGLVVGVFSALFGVGGGVIMVPFIVLAMDETQQLAEGTSLVVIVPTAIAGASAHLRRGLVSLRRSGLMAAGGIVGAVVGALIALAVSADSLQRVFAIFMAIVALRLIHQGYRQRASRK